MAKETFDRNKPDTTPPPPPPDNFVEVDIQNTAGALTTYDVIFDGQPDSDYYALIYVTMWMGPGTMRPRQSAFKLLCSMQVPGTPFAIDIKDAYLERLGQPALGNKIFTKVILIDSVSGRRYGRGTISFRVEGT